MPHTLVSSGTAASGGRRGATLVLVVLGLLAGGARAELLGTYPHRSGTVHLMTELCADDPTAGQRARQSVGWPERLGCWGVDRAGNPVVTWSDGSELVLNGDKVRRSRAVAGLLEERVNAPAPRSPTEAATPTARPRAEVPRAAAPELPLRSEAQRAPVLPEG